jgi:hypothetical protein
VDVPTLEVLASLAIRFTILAPQQARRVRPLAGGEWQDVPVGRVEAKLRYGSPASAAAVEATASGFRLQFDEPVYAAVPGQAAVLYEGDAVVGSGLIGSADDPGPQLLHVATDGETYGHHHNGGETALAERSISCRERIRVAHEL